MTRLAISGLLLVACAPQHFASPGAETDVGDCTCEIPDNTWPADPDAPCIQGETGFDEGDPLPDFLLLDQHGDQVSLCQLYTHVVLVDVSIVQCAPCQNLAEEAEATWLDLRDEDFVYVTVIAENVAYGDPTVEDVQAWAEEFGLTSPVLADPGKAWSSASGTEEYPLVLVLDRDLVVAKVLEPPFTDEAVRAAIAAEL